MTKKDLRHMSRRELVDIVYEMTEQETKPEELEPEEVAAERERLVYRQKLRRVLGSTVSTLVVVAAMAVLLSTIFLPVIQVSGDSMEPAMHDGDILLLMKTKEFDYGELCCVAWQNKLLLKRVIALPGDSVEIDEDGTVSVNVRGSQESVRGVPLESFVRRAAEMKKKHELELEVEFG